MFEPPNQSVFSQIERAIQSLSEEKKKETEEKTNWTVVEKPKTKPQQPKPQPVQKSIVKDEYECKRCTVLCNSLFTDGVVCRHGEKCRFAHRVEDLVRRACNFGTKCRFAKQTQPGIYVNTCDKICQFWHPTETVESYGERMGLKPKVKPKAKSDAKKSQPNQEKPVKSVPVKLFGAWKRPLDVSK